MNTVLIIACLLPLALAHTWGSGEEKGMGVFQKWQKEQKEKMMHMQKFHEFLQLKEKLMQMKEMEKKKAVYEEFMAWKIQKEQKDQEDNEKREHAGKFEAVLARMKEDGRKNAIMITNAFLELCSCHNDLKMEIAEIFHEDKMDNDSSDMGSMFSGDIPDFMGNNTAKAHFLMSLSKEQQHDVFGYALVKAMCNGANMYISHAKQFSETYMKEERSELKPSCAVDGEETSTGDGDGNGSESTTEMDDENNIDNCDDDDDDNAYVEDFEDY